MKKIKFIPYDIEINMEQKYPVIFYDDNKVIFISEITTYINSVGYRGVNLNLSRKFKLKKYREFMYLYNKVDEEVLKLLKESDSFKEIRFLPLKQCERLSKINEIFNI